MTSYRIIFQDSGDDTRSIDSTYTRVRVWAGERYLGAWLGLLPGRSRKRHLAEPEQLQHYDTMAPVALALAIREALQRGEFDAPRDVPLHPASVLGLPLEQRHWAAGDEVMAFEL